MEKPQRPVKPKTAVVDWQAFVQFDKVPLEAAQTHATFLKGHPSNIAPQVLDWLQSDFGKRLREIRTDSPSDLKMTTAEVGLLLGWAAGASLDMQKWVSIAAYLELRMRSFLGVLLEISQHPDPAARDAALKAWAEELFGED